MITMGLKDYCFDGKKECDVFKLPTRTRERDKEAILLKTKENQSKIASLQERLYAEGKEALILVIQAMDAAGKDSTIKHVMSGINPQGIDVHSFKEPTSEELAHDFLRKAERAIPERGKMAIFNRSYYEDVLVVKVRSLYKHYQMKERCFDGDFFKQRLKHIRHFEEYLYDESYRVVKIFLNVSKEKQKQRFLERINDPEKHWKFSYGDLDDRALWDDYLNAYNDAINATASKHAPWYVLPADQKWYTRYLVSEILVKALEEMDPHYPQVTKEQINHMLQAKKLLEDEK